MLLDMQCRDGVETQDAAGTLQGAFCAVHQGVRATLKKAGVVNTWHLKLEAATTARQVAGTDDSSGQGGEDHDVLTAFVLIDSLVGLEGIGFEIDTLAHKHAVHATLVLAAELSEVLLRLQDFCRQHFVSHAQLEYEMRSDLRLARSLLKSLRDTLCPLWQPSIPSPQGQPHHSRPTCRRKLSMCKSTFAFGIIESRVLAILRKLNELEQALRKDPIDFLLRSRRRDFLLLASPNSSPACSASNLLDSLSCASTCGARSNSERSGEETTSDYSGELSISFAAEPEERSGEEATLAADPDGRLQESLADGLVAMPSPAEQVSDPCGLCGQKSQQIPEASVLDLGSTIGAYRRQDAIETMLLGDDSRKHGTLPVSSDGPSSKSCSIDASRTKRATSLRPSAVLKMEDAQATEDSCSLPTGCSHHIKPSWPHAVLRSRPSSPGEPGPVSPFKPAPLLPKLKKENR